jgi:dUTP pyrophosphatase
MYLYIKLLSEDAVAPKKANKFDAGYDLSSIEDMIIPVNSRAIVPTGIAVATPINTYARIAPRSGLAAKHGIDVFAGVVDAGYRGEIKVILFNSSNENFIIKKGDRIAQLILEMIATPETIITNDLPSIDDRGEGGFGSSGV